MAADPSRFERIRSEVSPDDYAILYMTSGATGEPKMGVAERTGTPSCSNIDNAPVVLPVGRKTGRSCSCPRPTSRSGLC